MTAAGNATNVQISNAALPVELIRFTASMRTPKEVTLHWSAHEEINLDYYEVQHALDGKNFAPIHQTKAIKAIEYTHVHQKPQEGVNYYRLKMMDTNGDFKYSNTLSIDLKNDFSIEVFPNPVRQDNTIVIRANKNDAFALSS